MKKVLLKIENLTAKAQDKEILRDLSLEVKAGQLQAIFGPNASGKSTLANVVAGNNKYKIIKGKIVFKGKDITRLSPEARVKQGIALAWQNPPAVKGVKLSDLLKKIGPEQKLNGLAKKFLEREVNVNLSGGEKKISELLQIAALQPELLILDEIDSGLDVRKVGMVGKIIKKDFLAKGVAILMITHSGEMLNFLKPDLVNIMMDGKIFCRSKDYKKVLSTVKKYGYEKCKKCR